MAEKKTESKPQNLHQKMLEVMKAIEYLQKDDQVQFGSTKYKAMSEEKVTTTVRKEFTRLGLVMYPFEQEVIKDGNITTTNTKYRLVNTDDPLDYVDIASSGQGSDTQDKGVGKAMTYSFKYALLRTFAIPTGEDPDKVSSEELDAIQNNEKASKDHHEKKASEVKKLLQETDSNTKAFLEYFSDKYKREIANVDVMKLPELEDAIKMLQQKKADASKTPQQVKLDVKGEK